MSQGEPAVSPQTACGVGLFAQSQHCTGGAAPLLRYGAWKKKTKKLKATNWDDWYSKQHHFIGSQQDAMKLYCGEREKKILHD